MKLLDNYERSTGTTEQVTAEEVTETSLFLDAVLGTDIMKVHVLCYSIHIHTHFNSLDFCFYSTTNHFLPVCFQSSQKIR